MTRAAGYSAERFAVGRGDAASGEGRWKPIDRGPSCEAVPAGTHPPRRRSTTVRDSLPGVSTSLRPSPMDRSRTVADSRRTGSLASEVGPGSRATWARLLATQLGPEPHPSLNYKAILKNVPGTSSAIAHFPRRRRFARSATSRLLQSGRSRRRPGTRLTGGPPCSR